MGLLRCKSGGCLEGCGGGGVTPPTTCSEALAWLDSITSMTITWNISLPSSYCKGGGRFRECDRQWIASSTTFSYTSSSSPDDFEFRYGGATNIESPSNPPSNVCGTRTYRCGRTVASFFVAGLEEYSDEGCSGSIVSECNPRVGGDLTTFQLKIWVTTSLEYYYYAANNICYPSNGLNTEHVDFEYEKTDSTTKSPAKQGTHSGVTGLPLYAWRNAEDIGYQNGASGSIDISLS